ncbi:MAG TPA: hypothetical protein VOA41_18010 [Candidatus Dormibacteraeota bacterium]|nr:hypothetical protein [Candidatus Dormibacteraeota bacterium]
MNSTTRDREDLCLKLVLLLVATAAFAACAHGQAPPQTRGLTVTLLSTGCPAPRMDRFGPSILVEAGTEKLLFDCDRGAARRNVWRKFPYSSQK